MSPLQLLNRLALRLTLALWLVSLPTAWADAAQISVVSMVGNWHNPVYSPSNGISSITNGDPTSSISWGGTISQSGYDFTKTIPGPQTLPPAPTPLFPLGTFTHRNQDLSVNPAYSALQSVKLDVVLTLNVDGTIVGPLTFTFTFNHDETVNENSFSKCDTNKINPTSTVPCPDVVTFSASPTPTTFNVGGVDYTLAMSFVDGQGAPASRFITEEHQNNVANLVGQFTLPPPTPSCGDGLGCNGMDTCSNCPQDCGVCPPPFAADVQFSAASYTASESAAEAPITVTRTGSNLNGLSTVKFATSNGTGIAGTDYTGVSGTLTFNPNETSKTFQVPIINNGLANGNKTVNLDLSAPTGATLGTPSAAVLTITDAGQPPLPPPAPFINQLVPFSAPVGFSSAFTMRILGSNFDPMSAQVIWNGATTLPVISRSATEIDVTVNPALWSNTAGNYPVKVRNPGPIDSNQANFEVFPPLFGTPPPFVVSGPSANPNPTYTKTTTLSILGGSFSSAESALTYTWSLVGLNPASNVTFSNNGTHAGSTSVASFPMAGTYHMKATILDMGTLLAVESPVLDVVVVRDPKKIVVGPANQVYTVGASAPLNLSAAIVDQWDASLTGLTPNWASSAGSLSPAGLSASFSSVDASMNWVTISASLVNASSATVTGSAQVRVVVLGESTGDLANAKAYPVPFKASAGVPGVTFRGLTDGTTIRIFSTDGRLVQTLHSEGENVLWRVNNMHNESIASGVYFFRIENTAGSVKEGKMVIIQ